MSRLRGRAVRLLLAALLVLGGAAVVAIAANDKLRYSVWLRVPGARAVLEDPQSSTVPQGPVPAAPDALRGADDVRWGIATGLAGWGSPLQRARRVRATGAGWVRIAAIWRKIEPAPGDFRWAELDAEHRAAARAGLRVLLLPEIPPAWARPVQRRYPSDPRTYAAFAAQIAGRYGPGGTFWRANPDLDARLAVPELEILNEPWVRSFGDGTDARPRTYARLVATVGRTLRRQAPRARLLVAMESSWLERDGYQRPWIEPMFDEEPDLARWIDGVAVHPYSYHSPLVRTPGISRTDFRRVGDIQRLLAAQGAPNRDVWITELGYTSCGPQRDPKCLTDAGQGAAVRDVFTAVRRNPEWRIRMVTLYTLDDGPDARDAEHRFGLVDAQGRRKPAYRTWRDGIAAWPDLQPRTR